MRHMVIAGAWVLGCALWICAPQAAGQNAFVNFETPQCSPLAMTPDGSMLLACNTADNRLEVFSLASGTPRRIGSVSVGLEPVSVRARTNAEAWVVNHLSDSVSVVNLATMNVSNSIAAGDEPCDVVFAGNPQRAFVSVSQLNQVRVFDAANPGAPLSTLSIAGEEPRALATDGVKVYAVIFESGNNTTIIPSITVSEPGGPYGGQNPPPNAGTGFNPPIAADLPAPPKVSLIVRRQGNAWMDDNGHDWSTRFAWRLSDNDLAIIDAGSLAVTYAKSLMNVCMGVSVRPGTGKAFVVGTEATNGVRFEPRVNGTFVRVMMAQVDPASGAPLGVVDLNPHLLPYSTPSVPQQQRDLSIGDPRGMVWNAAGTRAYVSGMGSSNLIATDATGARLATIAVGQGPTGLALDAAHDQLYCLNRFDGTISTIDLATETETLPRARLYDPTPLVIRAGRPFLYDTHLTSGLGQASCGSCHVDGRTDALAWDLGDPSGSMKQLNQPCDQGLPFQFSCGDWHPMKGPMATQTLQGIVNGGAMHWRGDREDLAAFSGAFMSLLGDDAPPSANEMAAMENFVATIKFPPQPNRTMTDGLPTSVPGFAGNPTTGQTLFNNLVACAGIFRCNQCHVLPTGGNATLISPALLTTSQAIKTPHLRNLYEKTGFSFASTTNTRGFGFTHDGAFDNIIDFLISPQFTFTSGAATQQRRDIEAFLMCFPTGTHPAVGMQTTVLNGAAVPAAQSTLINSMISLANANSVGLIVKGRQGGIDRGYVYTGGNSFKSDRAAETKTAAALLASAAAGSELTYTVVPAGTQNRMGVDRDADGFPDRDEIDACSNPADPAVTPANLCRTDLDGSHETDIDDLFIVINAWGTTGPAGGFTGDMAPGCGDGAVGVDDLFAVINAWGACP